MTTDTGQATTQERIDPLVETLIKGLIETASHPKAVSPTEDAITAALMASLIPPAQASSFEKAVFAATLAPALAAALAPALAEALVPAIEKALNTIVSPKETGQESPPREGSGGM